MIHEGKKGFQKCRTVLKNEPIQPTSISTITVNSKQTVLNKRVCICSDNDQCFAIQERYFALGLTKYVGYTTFWISVDDLSNSKAHIKYLDSKFRNYCLDLNVKEPVLVVGENQTFYGVGFSHSL